MKLRTTLLAFMLIAAFLPLRSHAAMTSLITPTKPGEYQLSEQNQRLVKTYQRMFRYYSQKNFAHTRTVRVLLSNYPQHVEAIMYTAFERHPEIYQQLIKAAIDAEPAFTRDVITMALNMGIGEPAEIVRIAVQTEPSYADDIVNVASDQRDVDVAEIVRVAVLVEPQMAPSIMHSMSQQQPSQLDIVVQTVLESVPAMGNYLATWFNDVIGRNDQDASDEERALQQERARKVLLGAHRAGVERGQLLQTAAQYGITEQELDNLIQR